MGSLDVPVTEAPAEPVVPPPPDMAGTPRVATIAAAAIAAVALIFMPFGPYWVFAIPLLEGVLAYAVRRSGLSRTATLLSVAAPPVALAAAFLVTADEPGVVHHFRLIQSATFVAGVAVTVGAGVTIGTRSRRGRQRPDGSVPKTGPGVRVAWIALAVVFVGAAFASSAASKPDFIVTRADLKAAAPQMLSTYGSFDGTTPCDRGNECTDPTCRKAHGRTPFAYRSVCYVGKANHFTVMFSNASGDNYRSERGVFYRPNRISPQPDGVCTRHMFGRWWEFAPLDDPNCPDGFDHYTGEA